MQITFKSKAFYQSYQNKFVISSTKPNIIIDKGYIKISKETKAMSQKIAISEILETVEIQLNILKTFLLNQACIFSILILSHIKAKFLSAFLKHLKFQLLI